MNTTLSIDRPSPGTLRPAAESTDPTEKLRALSTLSGRELVHLAERNDVAGDRCGLDAARDEAERRARHQAPDGLAAQIAGYLGLLADDTEHALADEARAWSRELHSALAPDASVPAPRARGDQAVRP